MTTLTCRDGSGYLMDYIEGVLAADIRSALDAHLSGCSRCVAFVQAYRETPRILRDSTAFEIPAGIAASLRRFLAKKTGSST